MVNEKLLGQAIVKGRGVNPKSSHVDGQNMVKTAQAKSTSGVPTQARTSDVGKLKNSLT